MKLLVDCHCFDAELSQGITTYIRGIYSEMPRIADDIDFYFAAKDIEKIKKIFGEGDNIYYVELSSKGRLKRLLIEFNEIITKHGIDIAHYQYVSPLLNNCKTIVTLHDILFVDYPQYFPFGYRLFKGLAFKNSAKRADMLCTVSEYSRRQISKHYDIPQKEIVLTPNAVGEEFFSLQHKPHEDKKYILYVSRIEPRKNHIAILNAFKRLNLASKDYELVFIGKETVATPDLHNSLNCLNEITRSKIKLIDQVDFSELKNWYAEASLFIYPSLAEGFGIPPIEAAAAGVPVICNNATAMEDFTFFGENLIDINDEKLLDKCIIQTLSKPDKMNPIKEAIISKYQWKCIAEDFLREIRSHFNSASK